MSGLVAALGGGGARPELARAMLDRIAHRGPDGLASVTSGPALVGLAALRTTPDEEGVPLRRGAVTVALDGHLANRDELSADAARFPPSASDAEIVARAYELWGTRAPSRLRGEASFVLWDAERERLVAARDPMGIRPLYWAWDPGFGLRVASEPRALFADGAAPYRSSREQLGLAAVGLYNERDHTLLERVRAIPASHVLVARVGEPPVVTAYREFDLSRTTRYRSRQTYVEHFRADLERAVRVRSRTRGRLGAFVSGGLDSSSVATVARSFGPVSFLHAAFRSLPCDETAYARDVARFAHEILIEVDAPLPRIDPEGNPGSRVDPTGAPVSELLVEARGRGVSAVLSGFGGDELQVWKGHEIAEALRAGNLGTALAWTGVARRPFTREPWHLAIRYGLRPLVPASVRLGLRRFRGPPRFPFLAADLEQAARAESERRTREALGATFASPSARAAAAYFRGDGDFEITMRDVDTISARAGVELRHPLYDEDLLGLLLSFPADVRTIPGTTKALFRSALPDLLPPSVRLRTDKAEFGSYWDLAMRPLEPHLPRLLGRGRLVERGILRPDRLEAALGPGGEAARLDLLSLELWLRHHEKRGCDGTL